MHILLLSIAFTASTWAQSIPVIALQENGETVMGEISSESYQHVLLLTKSALEEQVVVGLESYADSAQSWQLKKFSLGIGASGEIGIGPFSFGANIRQRFVYSR